MADTQRDRDNKYCMASQFPPLCSSLSRDAEFDFLSNWAVGAGSFASPRIERSGCTCAGSNDRLLRGSELIGVGALVVPEDTEAGDQFTLAVPVGGSSSSESGWMTRLLKIGLAPGADPDPWPWQAACHCLHGKCNKLAT